MAVRADRDKPCPYSKRTYVVRTFVIVTQSIKRGDGGVYPSDRCERCGRVAGLHKRNANMRLNIRPNMRSSMQTAEGRLFLCEALNRILNKGVVVAGDVTISLADVDLIWIGLRLVVTSVETARRQMLEQLDSENALAQGVEYALEDMKNHVGKNK